MSSIYEDHRDEDGFLYITYSGENTFGGGGGGEGAAGDGSLAAWASADDDGDDSRGAPLLGAEAEEAAH